jgi:hypothetical protein
MYVLIYMILIIKNYFFRGSNYSCASVLDHVLWPESQSRPTGLRWIEKVESDLRESKTKTLRQKAKNIEESTLRRPRLVEDLTDKK